MRIHEVLHSTHEGVPSKHSWCFFVFTCHKIAYMTLCMAGRVAARKMNIIVRDTVVSQRL